MPSSLQTAFLLLLFIVLVPTVAYLMARASGWNSLVQRFPAVEQDDGERYRFASGRLARVPWFPVNFGARLIVVVSRKGFSMGTHFPFQRIFRDFFVPWEAVESVQEKSSALGRRTVVRLRGLPITLTLRGTVAQGVFLMHARVKSANTP